MQSMLHLKSYNFREQFKKEEREQLFKVKRQMLATPPQPMSIEFDIKSIMSQIRSYQGNTEGIQWLLHSVLQSITENKSLVQELFASKPNSEKQIDTQFIQFLKGTLAASEKSLQCLATDILILILQQYNLSTKSTKRDRSYFISRFLLCNPNTILDPVMQHSMSHYREGLIKLLQLVSLGIRLGKTLYKEDPLYEIEKILQQTISDQKVRLLSG